MRKYFCLVLYSELDAKAEEQCANSIEEIDCVYGFAHEEYIYKYIYIGFVTSKNEVFKPSHRQKSCTHIVPCSEKIRGNIWEKYIFHHHRWGVCCQWPQSWFLEANIGRVWPPALSQLGTYAPASNALLVEPGSHGRQPMGQPYFFSFFICGHLWTLPVARRKRPESASRKGFEGSNLRSMKSQEPPRNRSYFWFLLISDMIFFCIL